MTGIAEKPAIRVLVVDDSAFMRAAVSKTIASDPGIVVVGQARDGREAVDRARELTPDVITMDFNMPRMNGAEAVRAILAERPVPVVMLSAHTIAGARETIEALAAGAVDFVTKPDGEVSVDLAKIRDELLRKIRVASRARPQPVPKAVAVRAGSPITGERTNPGVRAERSADRISFVQTVLDPLVVIAISTGGPAALERVVPLLPRGFRYGVLVVQHMPAQFTLALASRLDEASALDVREASAGERVVAGSVRIAPGDRHVVLQRNGTLELTDGPLVNGCRPSADVTLQSAAPIYGPRLVALVMTGMGRDGALGAAAVRAAGGRVLAQDRESSVVWGMPRAVVEMGIVDEVLPLAGIASRLAKLPVP